MHLIDLGDAVAATRTSTLTPRVFESVYMIVASRP